MNEQQITMPDDDAPLGEWAIYYAALGFPVIPLRVKNKMAILYRWGETASNDPERVKDWWDPSKQNDNIDRDGVNHPFYGNPNFNIGILCGRRSGLLVVDVDEDDEKDKHGGEVVAEWEQVHGEFKQSWSVASPRGGTHFYYHHAGEIRKSENEDLAIDIRANGGYIVAPPSIHPNGRRYEWEYAPEDIPLAEPNQSVLDFVEYVQSEGKGTGTAQGEAGGAKQPFSNPSVIVSGGRVKTLVAFIASLLGQKNNMSDEEIRAAVVAYNGRCDESVSDRQLEREVFPAISRLRAKQNQSMLPTHFRDTDEATVFAREYGEKMRFIPELGYFVYDGVKWSASDQLPILLFEECSTRQFKEAGKLRKRVTDDIVKLMEKRGLSTHAFDTEKEDTEILELKSRLNQADGYHNYCLKLRDRAKTNAVISMTAPKVLLDVEELDKDPFLLNTPEGVVHLDRGTISPHAPEHFLTRMTRCSPSDHGADTWRDFLDQIFIGDKDLMRYMQAVMGLALIGRLIVEKLFILVGCGGNGKSSFLNVCMRALGSYAIPIIPDVLINDSRINGEAYLFELRGRRLAVMSELGGGKELSSGMLKRIVSTDLMTGCEKFKQPISFLPSHSCFLTTNDLPFVTDTDQGTWDRISVIPFNARFRNQDGERKDYASYLFEKCGGAVMKWMAEGAKLIIDAGYKLEEPEVVKVANLNYRRENDVMFRFQTERCKVGSNYTVRAKVIQNAFAAFCNTVGKRPNERELKKYLERNGFYQKETKYGRVYHGIQLLDD